MDKLQIWYEFFDHGARVFLGVEVESDLHDLVLMSEVFFFKELTQFMGLTL